MMNKKEYVMVFVVVTMLGMVLIHGNNVFADTVKCVDKTGTYKWRDTGHGDNSPSTSDFKQALKSMSICQIAKGIDFMKFKGAVREDTKLDWDSFKSTYAYSTTTNGQKICLAESYESPDSGKKNAEGYEILYAALCEEET